MNSSSRTSPRRMLRAGTAVGTAALLAFTVAPAEAGNDKRRADSEQLRAAVTPEGVKEHLETFQAIADDNDGTRASGTPGYYASVEYVMERMEAAGYRVTKQAFDFPFFKENAVAQLSSEGTTYTTPEDFSTMTFSGSGTATATAVGVDTDFAPPAEGEAITSGCESEDFADFTAGAIALIQRGGCTFGLKAENAQEAGASAAIIFNTGGEGAEESFAGTLGGPVVSIPVVGARHALGSEIAGQETTVVTDTTSETRKTYNVIAETKGKGRKGKAKGAKVVMAGAHLDGAIEGPGLNDNGSGAASLLEVAEQMAGATTRNRVRFAWWGAEELGLLGAEHYVADLQKNDTKALKKISLYLNFDMVGSQNYVRFVYDGDNSKFGEDEGATIGPDGSGDIEQVFRDYFASQDLESEETPFNGRSDYGPFIEAGIPAGGLFSGAEGIKTEEQAAIYGGVAGEPYDPCYHAACDDLSNISMDAIDEMSDAMAHAVWTYAKVLPGKGWDRADERTSGMKGHGKGHRAAQHDGDRKR